MAVEALPGRPGNMTEEQVQKLKNMWKALLDLFKVKADSANAIAPDSVAAQAENEDKKKDPKAQPADNDKYNQTKGFATALASQSPEELRESFWEMVKMETPDALMLRFLRARKWDVKAAIVMLISTVHWWKKEMKVDEIVYKGEAGAIAEGKNNGPDKKVSDEFMVQIRQGKSFLHQRDVDGRLIAYIRVKLHRIGAVSSKSLERLIVYIIETARGVIVPPTDTATIVFDMTDFSLANMDYTPVKFIIKCLEANYPESLGHIVIYKAPWIFSGIWKIIKGWLDPVVAAKVHFASNVKEISEFIPKDRLMKELGGDEQWAFEYTEPPADENAKQQDTAGRDKILGERKELIAAYEKDTLAWMADQDPAAAERRKELALKLQQNYWVLDPYIRARTLWDRLNTYPDVPQEKVSADQIPPTAA